MIFLATEEIQDVVQSPEEVAKDVNRFVQWFEGRDFNLDLFFRIEGCACNRIFLYRKSGASMESEDGEAFHATTNADTGVIQVCINRS